MTNVPEPKIKGEITVFAGCAVDIAKDSSSGADVLPNIIFKGRVGLCGFCDLQIEGGITTAADINAQVAQHYLKYSVDTLSSSDWPLVKVASG